ncbi:uncharacterized protein LOC132728904 [Ruditapes philippinarum]|uniref:uncharacterized protein LOC132728904 n=1 Tax=Ruditapes philippinarum TaxID=129788 RepID=UPI00295B903C|nr:uncharacterized protein LOC132728904 [Ruditapes philippinarum]
MYSLILTIAWVFSCNRISDEIFSSYLPPEMVSLKTLDTLQEYVIYTVILVTIMYSESKYFFDLVTKRAVRQLSLILTVHVIACYLILDENCPSFVLSVMEDTKTRVFARFYKVMIFGTFFFQATFDAFIKRFDQATKPDRAPMETKWTIYTGIQHVQLCVHLMSLLNASNEKKTELYVRILKVILRYLMFASSFDDLKNFFDQVTKPDVSHTTNRKIFLLILEFVTFVCFAILFPMRVIFGVVTIKVLKKDFARIRSEYRVTALKGITSERSPSKYRNISNEGVVIKSFDGLPRSRHILSDIRPGNAKQFKKAHDNTLSEQMVNNMSVKMKSVGAFLSSNFVIGTVFRVGSKYVMTALHVVKRITSLPRSLRDGVSNIRPGNANKFKKAHDNTLSEQMVDNMSVKMKSVGAIISRNFAIGTVFRVGSKYVMTALHVVKRTTSLPRRHTDGISDIRPENENEFKKAHDNTLSEQMVDNMSVKMKSVGAVVSSNFVIGTVFRVGSKYVMTALHVVKRITNPKELCSIADTDWSKLDDPTVYITFAGTVMDLRRPIFHIKPDVIYMNKQLDIAVLELSTAKDLPRSLTLSKDMGKRKCVSIIGFGQPNDSRKRLDANCEVLNINHIITTIDNYFNANPSVLQLNGLQPGGIKGEYIELHNTDMFPCHTSFEHGSSGAPAIEDNEVVGILVKGIPAIYYNLRDSSYFTASGIDKLPKNLMFELCIKPESIFNHMRSVVPMLAVDLFD